MDWQVVIALVIAIPVILFPVAFIWYLNFGGIYTAIKRAKARRITTYKKEEQVVEEVK